MAHRQEGEGEKGGRIIPPSALSLFLSHPFLPV